MVLGLGDFSSIYTATNHCEAIDYPDKTDPPQSPALSTTSKISGLGDFGNVWSFLGTPPPTEAKPLAIETPTKSKAVPVTVDLPLRQPAPKPNSGKAAAKATTKEAEQKPKAGKKAAPIPVKTPSKAPTKQPTPSPPKQKQPVTRPAPQPRTLSAPAPANPASEKQDAAPPKTPKVTTPKPVPASIVAPTTPTPKRPSLFPSSVPPPLAGGGKALIPERQYSKSFHSPRSIEPKVIRSGEDKDWDLFMRVLRDFPEDRKSLVAPMNLTLHNNDPAGIHLFVDASNIFIGFMNELKAARGIPDHVRVPRADLSFDSLALLMERRRPVAKRVLVGSTPHIPAFDKARAVGYQCSILEKVEKARPYTERQLFFMEQDERRARRAARSRTTPGHTSGSDTNTSDAAAPVTRPAPPIKKVEQGVDEILHLKICESVLDHPGQPGTIVLATGDAAEAEYSDGFLRTLERALAHGWRVELLSWSRSISQLYRRRNWQRRWGDRFRIIPLDDYAEELLDVVKEASA